MSDALALIFALGLGLLLGTWAGATYAIRIAERRRRAIGAHAQLARFWPAELPARSAADILAGIVRFPLGGRTYELPVLPRGAARRWLASLDSRFATLAADLEAAGEDTPAIMVRLVAEADALYDMLLEYDRAGAGVLPPRDEIDELATDTEILRAVIEVWRAVNPLPDTLAGAAAAATDGTPSARLTTPRSRTAGGPSSSSASPTSSSSPTSTPPSTASSGTPASSSSASSKPFASGRASSTTSAPTSGGASASARPRRPRPATGKA